MEWYIVVFLITGFITLTALAENDEGIWATAVSVALFLGYWWFFDRALLITTLNDIKDNPWLVFIFVILWIIAGLVWSFYKWYLYIKKMKERGELREKDINFALNSNKGRIMTWMTYWPFSVSWFIIHKPISRVYDWVYEKASGTYKRIYLRVFNDKPSQG